MTSPILHLEYISSGQHTPDRPRGLHPQIFGPGGSGWHAVADRLCPMLESRAREAGSIDVVLWCIGGVEPRSRLTIHDTPFDNVLRDETATPWSQRLTDRAALAASMGRLRMSSGGGTVWAYIGEPTSARPDSVLLSLVRAGLVGGVIFDASAPHRHPEAGVQFASYRAAGALLAYEASTTYADRALWTDPSWVCCSSVEVWLRDQANIAPHPPHPNRLVHHLAMANPVLLLDHKNGQGGTPYQFETIGRLALDPSPSTLVRVATNLLHPAWTGRRLDRPTVAPSAAGQDGCATDTCDAPPRPISERRAQIT